MKFNLHFTIPTFTEELDTFPIPENENYGYWEPLMKIFIEQSDSVEIHCWNDEKDVIKETALVFKGSAEIINGRDITISKGRISDSISRHLLCENVKGEGKLKWFSIFLSNGQSPLFHAEHWGTEFFAPNVSEQVIAYIKTIMPTGTDYHQYK